MIAPDSIARRFRDGYARRGDPVTLRRVDLQGDGQPSPPVLRGAVADGSHPAGSTTLAIRADAADGRLVPGDSLLFPPGARAYKVAAPATARAMPFNPAAPYAPGFDAVTLARPLAVSVADGAAIAFVWGNDLVLRGKVEAFSTRLLNQQVLATDLSVTLPAYGIDPPRPTDQLIIDDTIRSIVAVTPIRVQGGVVAWHLQAR